MITRRALRPSTALSTAAWTCPQCVSQPQPSSQALRADTGQTKASLLRTAGPRQQRRPLHSVPQLTFDQAFRAEGIPNFLSKFQYRVAWTEYQQIMVDKVNQLTAGEPHENTEMKHLVIAFARDPMAASLFNHASMAHNNNFFFENFSTHPAKLDKYPMLEQSLLQTFGSMETLRTTMLETAAAMFGPGFVWLVWARNLDAPGSTHRRGTWRILTTYLAGTPYPEAGYRQQGLDMNNNNASTYQAYMDSQPANSVGSFGSHTTRGKDQARLPPGGTSLVPVLCVNTWEHVWLRDYGMNGKRRYLVDWWECVNWHQVESMAPPEAREGTYPRT